MQQSENEKKVLILTTTTQNGFWNTLWKYHELYVYSDTMLLADVFENFRSMCIEIYKSDAAYFLSAPGLA